MARTSIPQDVQESLRDALDSQQKITIKCLLKQEIRPEKYENKLLAFSNWRLNICTAKAPCKLEHSFHYLDIQTIESPNTNKLSLTVDGKQFHFVPQEPDPDKLNFLITHIGVSLQSVFPDVPLERLVKKIDVIPPERLHLMHTIIKDKAKKDPGPCRGFSHMYASMCDYHHLPYRDDVAWDVDTIYLTHDTKELKLKDFDHLESRDWLPIISALENNLWFTGFNANNVRLTNDVTSEMIKVFRKNSVLEELSISNTGIKSDFIQKLSVALLSNNTTQLTKVDLSCNVLDDRGIVHFLGFLSKSSHGLSYLDLSKTGLTVKGINKLCESMSGSSIIRKSLKTLKISDNPMKGEDTTNLRTFLATPNVMTHLDLSGLDIPLEVLSGALVRGCVHHMSHLNLSRNPFSLKKTKDVPIPQSWKQLFSTFFQLSHLDLSNCKLPLEAIKLLFLGIASNINVNQLHLDLSGNELRFAPPYEIDVIIGHMTNLTSLDISNNKCDLTIEKLFKSLCRNRYLKRLSVGRNFSGIKAKYLPRVLDALVQLLHDENCFIEYLSLADSKLKSDTTLVINALGSNTTLKELDISGNTMEDVGARMLAKALQINNKLQTILWDKNGTTVQGFHDIADSLEQNYVLKKMPTPVFDATVAVKYHPEKMEAALQKIESLLQRNHNPRKFSSDQGYRLQQGFLISSTQQMVDRLVVQVQDTVNALSRTSTCGSSNPNIELAGKYVNDANNSQQLLPQLQKIAIKSQDIGNPVEKKLKSIALELQDVLASHIENTVQEMLNCAKTECSTVLQNEGFYSDLESSIREKQKLPNDLVLQALTDVSTDIFNKLSEMNLLIASHMSDRVLEEVIESLSKSHKQLSNKLMFKKRPYYSGLHTEGETVEKGDADDAALGKISEKPSTDENEVNSPTLKCSSSYRPIEMLQDLSDLDYSPKLNHKKKSLYGRKLRPQSVIVDAFDTSGSLEDLKPSMKQSLDSLNFDSMTTSVTSLPSNSSLEFDISPAHKLQHINKARPKRKKNHAITKPQALVINEVEDIKPNEGLNKFFGNVRTMKETVSTPEDIGQLPREKHQLDMNRYSSLSEADKPLQEKNDKIEVSPKHEAKPEVKKKNWNPFARKERIPNPFAKKPKPESPKHSQKSFEADNVKDEPKVNDRKSSSPSIVVPEDHIETSHEAQEKLKRSPIMLKINSNIFVELRKKKDPLQKESMSPTNSSDHNNSPKAVFKDPDVNDCLRNGLPHENLTSKPIPLPQHKSVTDYSKSDDTLTTCEDVSSKENKPPLQSPINRALPSIPVFHNLKNVSKPTEADTTEEKAAEKGHIEKSAVEKSAVEKGGVEKGRVEKGHVENSAVEKGGVEKGRVEKGHVEKSAVEKGGVEKGHVEKGGVEKGSQENLTSVGTSLKEEVTPINTKATVITETNRKSSIEECQNEKTLDQKAENEVENVDPKLLRCLSTPEDITTPKPKPAPRTSYSPLKPGMKPKPPPPVAPKPSVPSRPSLKRTSLPAVSRNSTPTIKEGLTKESSHDIDSGVVYDSATLRRSVQEKVSRLSKLGHVEKPVIEEDNGDCSDDEGSSSNKKCSSLPRDSQIPIEFKDPEVNVSSRPTSMFCETSKPRQLPSQKAATSQSSENQLKRQSLHSAEVSKSDTSPTSAPHLKIQSSNMLNISTDGLDTSRLSMCSSHHSSTEEAESDAEIIFL